MTRMRRIGDKFSVSNSVCLASTSGCGIFYSGNNDFSLPQFRLGSGDSKIVFFQTEDFRNKIGVL